MGADFRLMMYEIQYGFIHAQTHTRTYVQRNYILAYIYCKLLYSDGFVCSFFNAFILSNTVNPLALCQYASPFI